MPESEPEIDCDSLVTEDHKPVESIYFEKLYRLLTHSLYASWPGPGEGRPFLVLANVGWFCQRKTPAVVPDCLLSLDVICPEDVHVKQGHSRYQWDMGKPPEVVIEFVSDRPGGEETCKKNLYARLGAAYYVVFGPEHILSDEALRCCELAGGNDRPAERGPGRRSASACACGRARSRGTRTSGCAGAMPGVKSFPLPRKGPPNWKNASAPWRRSCSD